MARGEETVILDIKMYCKVTVMKTLLNWHGARKDRWNTLKSSESVPCTDVHRTYFRGQSNENRMDFSTLPRKVLGQLITHRGKMKLDPYFLSSTKVNSKWTEDILMKNKTINFSENNTEKYFHYLILEEFLERDIKAQKKLRIENLTTLKLITSTLAKTP